MVREVLRPVQKHRLVWGGPPPPGSISDPKCCVLSHPRQRAARSSQGPALVQTKASTGLQAHLVLRGWDAAVMKVPGGRAVPRVSISSGN